jgi:hypothetical protein
VGTKAQVRYVLQLDPKICKVLTLILDYYHVACFEDLADFSQASYLDLVVPLTRKTAGMRGIKGTSVADGNYLLDGGAERLILEWKVSMENLIKRRDGITCEPLEPDFDDLLHKSGSASYTPKIIDRMAAYDILLFNDLAPIESDGVDDKEEWNLFEQYLALTFDDLEDLNEPHSLSEMLDEWKMDQVSYKCFFNRHVSENSINIYLPVLRLYR